MRLSELDAVNNACRGGAETLGEIAILLAGFTVTSRYSDAQAAAQAQVYADATNDIPAWAIVAARKAWARGETEGLKGKIDPSFPPAPAHVRTLALKAMAEPAGEAMCIARLLSAKAEKCIPIEDRQAVLNRLSGILGQLRTPAMPSPVKDIPPAEHATKLRQMAAEVAAEAGTVDSDRGGQ